MAFISRSLLACGPLATALVVPSYSQGLGTEVELFMPLAYLQSIVTLDVDGDGDLDIVAAGHPKLGAIPTMVLLENVGVDGFASARALLPGTALPAFDELHLGDLDADGDDDLVFVHSAGTELGWLRNDGGGLFVFGAPIASGTGSVECLSVVDLDGDGVLDLAELGAPSELRIRLGQGGGLFDAPAVVAGDGPYADVIAEDFDADGELDLVFIRKATSEVQWARNLGNGAFAPAATLGVGPLLPIELRGADVDADGDLDFVVSRGGGSFIEKGVSLLLNDGSGALVPPVSIGDLSVITFELADMDADGLDDIVISRAGSMGVVLPPTLFVAFNLGGSFGPPQELFTVQRNSLAVLVEDMDQDGDIDVVAASTDAVSFFEAGPGGIKPGVKIAETLDDVVGLSAADIDGDGRDDLAVIRGSYNGRVAWYRSLEDGRWSGALFEAGMIEPLQLEVVDMDGDGDLDLLMSGGAWEPNVTWVAWVENLGRGEFQDLVYLRQSHGNSGARFSLGDMEGDGDLDVLWSYASNITNNTVFGWSEQTSPGQLSAGPSFLYGGVPAPEFALADIDADGIADIVEWRPGGNQPVHWGKGSGGGSLGIRTPIHPAGAVDSNRVLVEDLNADGLPDVLVGGSDGVLWYANGPGGNFAPALVLDPTTGEATELSVAPMGGDGFVDVFASSLVTAARRIENLGGGVFAAPVAIPGMPAGRVVSALGDIDGDLDTDVISLTDGPGVTWNANLDRQGTNFCGPAAPNSSGQGGALTSRGAGTLAANDTVLMAERLPAGTFGFFLVATADDFVQHPGGSQGILCLGGPLGRLNRGPAEIFFTDPSGRAEVTFDATDVPTPTGAVSLVAGDTRYFQGWFRDANPTVASNFTNGLALTFE